MLLNFAFTYLVLIFKHCVDATVTLEFLEKLDLTMLDWLTPDTISVDHAQVTDEDMEILAKIAINGTKITHKKVGLFITNAIDLIQESPYETGSGSGDYIKNPKLTFLLKHTGGNRTNLEKLPKINMHPYHYIWIQEADYEQLLEYQRFSASAVKTVPLVYWNKSSNRIRYENQDIYERRRDFYGNSIRIAGEKVPYRFSFDPPDDPNGELSGFNGKLLHYFRKEFNFTIDWKPFESYGLTLANGSWTGSIGDLINDKLDFAPGWFTHSKERMSVVSPGFRLFQDTHSVLYRSVSAGSKTKPQFNFQFWSLLEVFDGNSWLLILALTLFLLLCFAISLKLFNNDNWIMSSISTIGLATLCLSVDFESLTKRKNPRNSIHALVCCLFFFNALVFWFYAGSLTSVLVTKNNVAPLEKLDDLRSKSRFKLFVKKGGVTEAFLLQWANESQDNLIAYQRFVKPYTYINEESARVLAQVSIDDQSAVLRETTSLIGMLRENWPLGSICDFSFKTIKEVPMDFLGWLYPQDSMLQPLFDRFFFKLSKSGITMKLLKEFIKASAASTDCQHHVETSQINFGLVEILFWILLLGIILALITFLIELLFIKNPSF